MPGQLTFGLAFSSHHLAEMFPPDRAAERRKHRYAIRRDS
jgi:hypothetical protein